MFVLLKSSSRKYFVVAIKMWLFLYVLYIFYNFDLGFILYSSSFNLETKLYRLSLLITDTTIFLCNNNTISVWYISESNSIDVIIFTALALRFKKKH